MRPAASSAEMLQSIRSILSPPGRFRLLLGLGIAGLLARLVLVLISQGSNDIFTWKRLATVIAKIGLVQTYETQRWLNQPPLMGYYAVAILKLSQWSGLPFRVLFKLPMVAADAGSAWLIWKIWSRRASRNVGVTAIACFGWALNAMLISGYHGSTDSLCAFFCLLSAYCGEQLQSDGLAGLALGAAINVKLIPTLLIAPSIAAYRSFGRLARFMVGLGIAAVPFALPLIFCPRAFFEHAMAYNSYRDLWGLPAVFTNGLGRPPAAQWAEFISNFYDLHARTILFGTIFAVSLVQWLRRRHNRYELLTLAAIAFLVLTPGFGVQYTVYVCPLLFAVDWKAGAKYSFLAGMFIGSVYLICWNGKFPAVSIFAEQFPMPTPLFGFLVWCFLIVVAIRLLRRVPPGVLGGPTNQDDLRGLDNLFPQAHPTATARFLAKEADADFPKKARSQ
jgi:hypothetical protein